MSMPSSSEAVATSTERSPARRRSSTPGAPLLRETAVMRRDLPLADLLAELVRDALGEPPRVAEDQRGAVLRGQLRDALEDLAPLLHRGDRGELAAGNLDARDRARAGGPRPRRRRPGCRPAGPGPAPIRPASAPASRSGAAWRRDRCAAAAAGTAPPAARARAARCEPRLSRATAWISSTITVSHRAQPSRATSPAVSSR